MSDVKERLLQLYEEALDQGMTEEDARNGLWITFITGQEMNNDNR